MYDKHILCMYNEYIVEKPKVKSNKFLLRLPDDVREAIEESATRFDGNLTTEILYRLRESLGLLPSTSKTDTDTADQPKP